MGGQGRPYRHSLRLMLIHFGKRASCDFAAGTKLTSKLWRRTGRPTPVAVLLLLALFGSVVPAGGDTVAVLSIVAPFVVVPLIVTVTLLLAGNVVTEPLTVLPATFTALQTGLPLAGAQV